MGQIQTDKTVVANPLDIMVVNQQGTKEAVVDIINQSDGDMRKEEHETLEEDQGLPEGPDRMWERQWFLWR